MKKKVILTICLIVVLVLGLFVLTGCGNSKEETVITNTQTTQKEEVTTNEEKTTTDNSESAYTYKDGVLTPIVDEDGNPKQTDFVIDGIILVGNHHEYREDDTSMGIIEYLAEDGYKKEDINKDFYLGEWIELYVDTDYTGKDSNVKILITPHKTVEELEKMSLTELEDLANENGGYVIDYAKPDPENHNYVGNGYVSPDSPEGKYDVLFTYKGKLAYYINVNLTTEPQGE